MFTQSHSRHVVAYTLLGLLIASLLVATEQDSSGQPSEKGAPSKDVPVTDAERIAQLTRTIEADTKQFEEIQKEMTNPTCEFSMAEKAFNDLDKRWTDYVKALSILKNEKKDTEAKALEESNASLKQQREDAQQRFDLAIQGRKTQQELAASLQKKIEQDESALSKLRGGEKPKTTPTEDSTKSEKTNPRTTPVKYVDTPSVKVESKDKTAVTPAEVVKKKEEKTEPVKDAKNQQLTQAKAEAMVKEKAAESAQADVDSIDKRLAVLRESMKLDQKLYENAQKKVDQSQQSVETLERELFTKVGANEDEEVLQEVLGRLENERKRSAAARTDLREIADRLHNRETELQKLLAEQVEARQAAGAKRLEAEAAKRKVKALQSPFHPENIRLWLYVHGPNLIAIVVAMILLRWLSRVFSHRVIRVMTHSRSGPRGTGEEKANRAETLVSVFRNFTAMLIIVGGVLMILDEIGVPIIPLMGGAAVLGLAVAFGAQNLIRDYFSGFMVLMEDQYSIHDVVKINGVSGTVEYISLRMTVLRDVEGIVHFIPHGSLSTVSNMTHGWSRAFFEIGVAYKEEVDRVIRVLHDLATDLRHDPAFGSMIVDDVEMLGVDGFGDSAVTIKFFLKTKPLKQWLIKRELLRRIKNRFDELGIEIPFPHRTVYHHHEKQSGEERQVA